MKMIVVPTKRKDEVIDLTETIESFLEKGAYTTGVCVITAMHTTCAITTADLDPGTDLDLLDALRQVLPNIHYRHPHDPSHTPDHILSSIIGPSVTIPVASGQLLLGTWQRIILIEFDGPRNRNIVVSFLPEQE